jgi:hypothetical protein
MSYLKRSVSKPSSTYHTYISFLIVVKICRQLGKKTKKKKMMIGFLDGVNVHHNLTFMPSLLREG